MAVALAVVVTVVVGFIGFVLLFKHDKRFSGPPYAGFFLHSLYSFYPVSTLLPSFTAFYSDLDLEFHLSHYSFFTIYPM